MSEDLRTANTDEGIIESELARHGVYASITRGTSMRPLFKTHRDMAIIKPVTRELKKYDVVVYTGTSGNRYTMHRIIGIRDDVYVIRGDNTYKKEYVPRECIIGILTEFNRRGKRHSTDEFSFKLYSRIWHYLYPLRSVYMKHRRLAGRIYHKIFG